MKRMYAAAAAILLCLALCVAYLRRDGESTHQIAKPGTETPTVSPSKADDPIDIVSNQSLPLQRRLTALATFESKQLSVAETAALREMMFRTGENETLRNNCGGVLLRQTPRIDLMDQLIASHKDENETQPWVDYSAQFMGLWYESSNEVSRRKAVSALVETAEREDEATAGTALLSLERIIQVDPPVENEVAHLFHGNLVSSNEEMAGAAMNIAIMRNDSTVLPLARQVAMKPGAIRLRLTNIAALGEFGDSSDLARLEKLSKDRDSRVRRVAKYQMRQLKKRLANDQNKFKQNKQSI